MEWKRGLVMLMASLALGVFGCGDDDGGDGDAGGGEDSGPPGGDDTGPPGGEDSGPPGGEDSGPPSGMDSGPPAGGCAAMYAGCATFDDMTGAGTVTIGIVGFEYSPKCIRVNVGQMVSVPAEAVHPINGACGPGDMNPIMDGATMPQTVTFDTPGVYGINCMNHGAPDGTGMAGAIEVVP